MVFGWCYYIRLCRLSQEIFLNGAYCPCPVPAYPLGLPMGYKTSASRFSSRSNWQLVVVPIGFTLGPLLMRCQMQAPTSLFLQYLLCFVVMLHHCLFQTIFVTSRSNSKHSTIVVVMIPGHLLDDMLPRDLES